MKLTSLAPLLAIALTSLLLAACTSTSHNSSQLPAPKSSNELAALGIAKYQAWQQQPTQLDTLTQALQSLKQARDLVPENAYYQLSYYEALAEYERQQSLQPNYNFDEQALLIEFNKVAEVAKAELLTPAFISFIISSTRNHTLSQQQENIFRAISQNPGNSQNWYYASFAFSYSQHHELAAHAVQQAINLWPKAAEYYAEQSSILSALSQHLACSSRETELLEKASKAIAQALTLEPSNADFLSEASNLYLKLRLYPLALAQAQRAYNMQANAQSLEALFQALYFNQRFEQAFTLLQENPKSSIDQPKNRALQLWYQLSDENYVAGLSDSELKAQKLNYSKAYLQADRHRAGFTHLLSAFYLLQLPQEYYQAIINRTRNSLSENDLKRFEQLANFQNQTIEALPAADDQVCPSREQTWYQALVAASQGDQQNMQDSMKQLSKQGKNQLDSIAWWALMLSKTASSQANEYSY